MVAEVDSIIVARKMVTRGLGYTIGLRRNAQAEIDRGLLAARPIRGLYLTLYLCRALMFAPSRAVHEVQRTLVRIAKDAWRDAD